MMRSKHADNDGSNRVSRALPEKSIFKHLRFFAPEGQHVYSYHPRFLRSGGAACKLRP